MIYILNVWPKPCPKRQFFQNGGGITLSHIFSHDTYVNAYFLHNFSLQWTIHLRKFDELCTQHLCASFHLWTVTLFWYIHSFCLPRSTSALLDGRLSNENETHAYGLIRCPHRAVQRPIPNDSVLLVGDWFPSLHPLSASPRSSGLRCLGWGRLLASNFASQSGRVGAWPEDWGQAWEMTLSIGLGTHG
jgi:hypothetical protein